MDIDLSDPEALTGTDYSLSGVTYEFTWVRRCRFGEHGRCEESASEKGEAKNFHERVRARAYTIEPPRS